MVNNYSYFQICHINFLHSDEELICLMDATVPNMNSGQTKFSNYKPKSYIVDAHQKSWLKSNQSDCILKEKDSRSVPSKLQSDTTYLSTYSFPSVSMKHLGNTTHSVVSTSNRENYYCQDNPENHNFLSDLSKNSYNGDEKALSIDNESINWSPRENINSSGSTDDALSQSSHRYGKVLAWKKGTKSSKNDVSICKVVSSLLFSLNHSNH